MVAVKTYITLQKWSSQFFYGLICCYGTIYRILGLTFFICYQAATWSRTETIGRRDCKKAGGGNSEKCWGEVEFWGS